MAQVAALLGRQILSEATNAMSDDYDDQNRCGMANEASQHARTPLHLMSGLSSPCFCRVGLQSASLRTFHSRPQSTATGRIAPMTTRYSRQEEACRMGIDQ
jgi:hypothetical protein